MRGNFMFYEHVDTSAAVNQTVWTPYYNVMLGIVIISGIINKHVKLYFEVGAVALFPSPKFSTETSAIGGYGIFGFEFFMESIHSYYIEADGIGAGTRADKLPNNPIYSTGLMLSVGYRVAF